MNGLYGTTGFYPKFLWDLLAPAHVISYSGCLVQALVMYSFGYSDLSILAVMAYDRYVAICRPLEYHSIMSKQRLLKQQLQRRSSSSQEGRSRERVVTALISSSQELKVATCDLLVNVTIVLDVGLNGTMNHRLTLFSLTFLCYCLILLVNGSVIVTIVLDKSLHEPMYILLCIFCMNELYGTTGFYPKLLWDLLAPAHVISYSGCLVQALVMYSFAYSDLSILAVMAYDRYVAICRPLEYHSIMSKQKLLKFVEIEFIFIPPTVNPLIYGFKLTKIRSRILAVVTALVMYSFACSDLSIQNDRQQLQRRSSSSQEGRSRERVVTALISRSQELKVATCDLLVNVTIVLDVGLNETMDHRLILFSLTFLCYCLILLVNGSVIVTIVLDKSLHEPMYILLCVFCMNELYGTTGFYPKFLWDLLAPAHVISYSGCLVQSLVISSFAYNDLSILAVMAYDRYVAICRPLQYHSIVSKQRLLKVEWNDEPQTDSLFSHLSVLLSDFAAINIFLTSRLKLCSPHIARLYCVNWIIVKLACFPAQTTLNAIVAYVTIITYVFHGIFILWSYMYVIKMCVNSVENRRNFMQTCVPHLSSLLIFLVTIVFDVMNMRFGSKYLSQHFENFVALEFLVVPPIMNPLIYGVKLTKIRNRILGVFTIKSRSLLSESFTKC
ncbi:uncharacterized protein V6R79_009605 [Siganus canaliculatus]